MTYGAHAWPRPSRRAVLLVAGATLLGACGDPDRETARERSRSSSTDPEEHTIFDLTLDIVDRFRPVELVAPGFAAHEGGRTVTTGLHRHDSGPAAPYAAVLLDVAAVPVDGSVAAGLATADGEHVLVRWSARSGRLSLEVRTDGRTRVLRYRVVPQTGAFGLAFAVCENQVTALVDAGEGWQPLLTERAKVAELVDLRREDVLEGYAYAWGGRGVRLGSVRAGLFGMTGLRDPHLVQHADGSPYVVDGRVYVTWTCAGLGFCQQAHWSVWSLDPAEPRAMRLESQLFTRRDGLVLGDHAGQLVRDGDRWLVLTSSWGDFAPGSIHVRHTSSGDDLLSGVHLLPTERAPLPTDVGSWDPALTRIDGRWRLGFVESPSQDPFDFHPALAETAARDWTDGLEKVAAADNLHQCEGPVIAAVDGTSYLLASDKDNQNYPVFDLAGRRLGRLDAPYPTNIPHPQLVPDPAAGWLMLTFDGEQWHEDVMGYGGHGDVVVMHSA